MNLSKIIFGLAALSVASLSGCSGQKSGKSLLNPDDPATGAAIDPIGVFNADSAFNYVRRQVSFGPRVAGSEGNALCQAYIIEKLRQAGAVVTEQKATVTAFDDTELPINNIMGRFNPEDKNRIMFLAHYDTRPWADMESSSSSKANKPIPGANDGGSGVAVLLELARQLEMNPPQIGVDLLFVDAEDYGNSSGWGSNDETWCLGTQHWIANHPYTAENLPRYCIVVDMVGGVNAVFHREFLSMKYAPGLVDKVWAMAQRSGYGDRFINHDGGSIIDDHFFVNLAGIPAIDIIESRHPETHSFPPTWHTHNDDIQNIDKASLKAVGQTLLNLIQSEE